MLLVDAIDQCVREFNTAAIPRGHWKWPPTCGRSDRVATIQSKCLGLDLGTFVLRQRRAAIPFVSSVRSYRLKSISGPCSSRWGAVRCSIPLKPHERTQSYSVNGSPVTVVLMPGFWRHRGPPYCLVAKER